MSPRTACLTVTRTGLRIGLAHQRAPEPVTGDHLRLQAALLDRRTAARRPMLMRVAGAVWRWL